MDLLQRSGKISFPTPVCFTRTAHDVNTVFMSDFTRGPVRCCRVFSAHHLADFRPPILAGHVDTPVGVFFAGELFKI